MVPLLQSTGLIIASPGLNCSMACGIFVTQGSNLGLLHWQADSLRLSHQGNPSSFLFLFYFVEVWLIYNVGFISAVQPSDSLYIYIHSYSYFFIMIYRRILDIAPSAIRQDLVAHPSRICKFASGNPKLPSLFSMFV